MVVISRFRAASVAFIRAGNSIRRRNPTDPDVGNYFHSHLPALLGYGSPFAPIPYASGGDDVRPGCGGDRLNRTMDQPGYAPQGKKSSILDSGRHGRNRRATPCATDPSTIVLIPPIHNHPPSRE